jgi:glutamyl/glutaminyl-tRNA synthetase
MDTSKSKEKILERIQEGLKTAKIKEFDKPELANKEIFVTPDKPLVEIFRDELTNISGQFYFCNNHEELIENLKAIHQEKKLDLCYSPDTKI